MEEAITGDFALIKAWKADPEGNLLFRLKKNSYKKMTFGNISYKIYKKARKSSSFVYYF